MGSSLSNSNNPKGSVLPPPKPIHVDSSSKENLPSNDLEMPLLDHLEELRQRVLRSLIAVVVLAVFSLVLVLGRVSELNFLVF